MPRSSRTSVATSWARSTKATAESPPYSSTAARAARSHSSARSAPRWWLEAVAMTAPSRALPALSRAFGSAQRSRTARSARERSPLSGVIGRS
jgi:hypothetical protein